MISIIDLTRYALKRLNVKNYNDVPIKIEKLFPVLAQTSNKAITYDYWTIKEMNSIEDHDLFAIFHESAHWKHKHFDRTVLLSNILYAPYLIAESLTSRNFRSTYLGVIERFSHYCELQADRTAVKALFTDQDMKNHCIRSIEYHTNIFKDRKDQKRVENMKNVLEKNGYSIKLEKDKVKIVKYEASYDFMKIIS